MGRFRCVFLILFVSADNALSGLEKKEVAYAGLHGRIGAMDKASGSTAKALIQTFE